ncbi:O-antigen ligase family protein [Rhizobium sp. L80/93]|uniref:O-antigen ligase family protein n=1 Tax=unclassified Rhizobium TaxID=2613769 RepID=UPI001AD9F28B|nr:MULTISPECIES: O-antigen ligase family protein [unclassified Rhizobium]MBO9136775.1 O-antigen ligase family protein [Rhizobium sp. B209b/85]MBO9188004.1 O-antigen ligase family protein [Rhizobium sp. E27B/91]QXZ99080.1 O-antigen ligase family protein [Rhizobium sp. B230/85]
MIQSNIKTSAGRRTSQALRTLYVISVFLPVLEFGAVRLFPLTIATMFSVGVALLSLVIFGSPKRARSLFLTFLLLGLATFSWVWMQTFQFLPSSTINELWNDLPMASVAARGSISIVPADSIATLLFVALPLLSFLTGLLVIRTDGDARMVINSLGVGGALCAIYGLIQFSFFPTTNLFFQKDSYLDSLTATFVNRNTAGTFLGIVTLITLRFAWSYGRKISVGRIIKRRFQNRNVDSAGLGTFLVSVSCAASAAMALMLTKSRGATASSLLALGVMLYLTLEDQNADGKSGFSRPRTSRKGVIRFIIVAFVLIVCFSIFGGRAILRAEIQGGDDGRYCVLPGIIDLARGEPIFGYGFGSFLYAFPPFRDPACGIINVWDRAHNVFLEGYIGLGVLFPALVLVGGGSLIAAHIIGLRERRRMRSYAVVGLAVIVLVGLHSLVDFSIQIPGMATYAASLLAATSSICLAKTSRASTQRAREPLPTETQAMTI